MTTTSNKPITTDAAEPQSIDYTYYSNVLFNESKSSDVNTTKNTFLRYLKELECCVITCDRSDVIQTANKACSGCYFCSKSIQIRKREQSSYHQTKDITKREPG